MGGGNSCELRVMVVGVYYWVMLLLLRLYGDLKCGVSRLLV